MPEIDTLAIIQLIGLALTWFTAVACGIWRIKISKGEDRDILIILGLVGGFIFLTLIQFIGLIYRLG